MYFKVGVITYPGLRNAAAPCPLDFRFGLCVRQKCQSSGGITFFSQQFTEASQAAERMPAVTTVVATAEQGTCVC